MKCMLVVAIPCIVVCSRTKKWIDVKGNNLPDEIKIPGQATLGFSFLSIPIWVKPTNN